MAHILQQRFYKYKSMFPARARRHESLKDRKEAYLGEDFAYEVPGTSNSTWPGNKSRPYSSN
jgi:hypothetical protein